MLEVFAGVSDTRVYPLDPGFRLFPVFAEFDLATHTALVACKTLLMFLEAVDRFNVIGVVHGREPGNTNIDADGRGRNWQWLLDITPRLDGHKPFSAGLADSNVAQFA